jgi:hypothetical protein
MESQTSYECAQPYTDVLWTTHEFVMDCMLAVYALVPQDKSFRAAPPLVPCT